MVLSLYLTNKCNCQLFIVCILVLSSPLSYHLSESRIYSELSNADAISADH
jgi:hypothetical protein